MLIFWTLNVWASLVPGPATTAATRASIETGEYLVMRSSGIGRGTATVEWQMLPGRDRKARSISRSGGINTALRQSLVLLALATTVMATASRLQSQEPRRVAGLVVAAADTTPLDQVWVGVVGVQSASFSDSAGHFILRIPSSARPPFKLTIRRVGLRPDTVAVPVGSDSVTIFARTAAIRLGGIGIETEVSPARTRFDTLAQPSIISLSPRELTRAPGLLEPDVIRAVQLLPGTVARNDYSIGYNVRGGESDQNLVLVDGITIFNPSHVGGLFSAFDANAIEKADFLTGGFPAGYSGRLSSVLDVALRPGSHEHFHGS